MDGGSEGCQSALPYGMVRYGTVQVEHGPNLELRGLAGWTTSGAPQGSECCSVWYCQ